MTEPDIDPDIEVVREHAICTCGAHTGVDCVTYAALDRLTTRLADAEQENERLLADKATLAREVNRLAPMPVVEELEALTTRLSELEASEQVQRDAAEDLAMRLAAAEKALGDRR